MQGEGLTRPASPFRRAALLPAVVALFAASAVAPAAAAASPTWLSPEQLSAAGASVEAPSIGLDAAGDAMAVWRRFDGADFVVQEAQRPAGGSWSAPIDLSAAGQSSSAPALATDAAGDAVAVWSRFDGAPLGSNSIVQASYRPAGGSWGAPQSLSLPGRNADSAQVALDAAGNATAVWRRTDGNSFIVQAASRPAGGSWSAPAELSKAGHSAQSPQVAVDRAGDATAIWQRFDGSDVLIEGAERAAGAGQWGEAAAISAAGEDAEDPQLGIDAAGTATAVWSRSDGSNLLVEGSSRARGGAWAPPGAISAPGRDARAPQLAVDPAGEAAAVWARENGTGIVVQAATRGPGGAWAAPLDLSPPSGLASSPDVAIGDDGLVAAVWLYAGGSPTVVQSALRAPGAAWEPRAPISQLGLNSDEPDVALDPHGDGVGAWSLEQDAQQSIQAIGLDGAPPDISSAAIPAAATIHLPAYFSVTPFDIWSPIHSIAWNFAGEAAAATPAATHTFDTLGDHPVSVTVTDAVGNTATATGTVRVYPEARAGHNGFLRRQAARLRVHCPSPAGCQGSIRLFALSKSRRRGRRVTHRLLIGGTGFGVPGGETIDVEVPLRRAAPRLVRAAMPRGLKAQLTGPGIKHRVVVLRARR